MRILVVVENLSVPFDRRVWQECRSLTRAGHEVAVICPRGRGYDLESQVDIEGVEIHRYDLAEARGGPLGYVREYGTAIRETRRLARRLAAERAFDAVHLCNPPDILVFAVRSLRRSGTLTVFDHHDLVPELAISRFGGNRGLTSAVRVTEQLTFDRADAVLCTNRSYADVAMGRGGVPASRVAVVRSAPDLDKFHPVEPDPALRRGRRYLACYLGVMGPQDGVDLALRALAHYHHDLGRRDLHTTFLGSGDMFDDTVALAGELDLLDHVDFTGRVPDQTVLRVLSTADVALAPDPKNPLNDVSSMNKIVEYLALGTPVVSFDLLETERSAGEGAVYVEDGDLAGFATAIAELLDDPDDRRRRAELGQQRVLNELSWEVSERALLEAYEHLTPRTGRRGVVGSLRRAFAAQGP